jgi:hypothetical protein
MKFSQLGNFSVSEGYDHYILFHLLGKWLFWCLLLYGSHMVCNIISLTLILRCTTESTFWALVCTPPETNTCKKGWTHTHTHTQMSRLTFFYFLMDRFKIHDCCFKKQKKANKNNVKSCTKYSIYKEMKAIKKKHDTWWAQESHWWCHFSIWARKYPKIISKKHKVISLTRSAYELWGWGSVCFQLARSPLDLPWCLDELLASQTTQSTTSSSFICWTLSIHIAYI